ncbi:imidazolonepropionase-like amidohydrolase [Sphingomonas kaistensis]|uniref:Imidazolonepropionase-like amidohydrolase n=1 Tax=Sphingomonas kaistensis TaxID=298708 RepID=A0A7X6BFH6_9SPHN|nr:amidohydrolase family protein [Sphingomonas kaistensis]NJC04460.1 imidazolonepropionase-like amidohydrolase [Sphingomonas kaistensis]
MLSLIAAAAVVQAAPPAQPVTVIHAGTLIDVPGRAPKRNASIIVQGRKIVEIRSGFADVPGARVVDLRTSTVMPGLIDSHVHLGGLDDRLQARLQAPVRNEEDEAYTALTNAKKTLAAGFTTVRDLGGDPPGIRALKGAINSGAFVGPSIIMAARMISVSGGHGDPVNGVNRELAEIGHDHQTNVCNGVDDCRRATREQIRDGADVVKIAATGGVLSNVAGGLNQQMADDEMKAVVDTARSFDRKVAAHAHGTSGINGALRAGVSSIEHGTFANDESFRLYKQTGAYYVPTLLAPAAAYKDGERGALTPAQFEKAAAAKGNAEKSFARAVREGVKIAFGTDSAVSPHGKNAEEFALMVRNGMAPADAIKAATVNAADLLGVSAVAGTIEPGKDADIVAVEGDPIANIRLLENVGFVMKWGQVFKANGQRQLTAAD